MKKVEKRRSNWQIIILCIFCTVAILGIWTQERMVKAVEVAVGTQQNFKLAENEEGETPEVKIEQEIEKYIKLAENEALVQQKIAVINNQQSLAKEAERLQIKVPEIQGKKPKSVVLLVNGKKVDKNNYQYTQQSETLDITISKENRNR